MTIGDRIKQEREKAGLSQVELARAAAIRQAAVSDIETGKVGPRWEHLVKITDALGVKMSALVKGL